MTNLKKELLKEPIDNPIVEILYNHYGILNVPDELVSKIYDIQSQSLDKYAEENDENWKVAIGYNCDEKTTTRIIEAKKALTIKL